MPNWCWKRKKAKPELPATMSVEDAIWWMEYAKEIHEYWLTQPEDPKTGTHEWHEDWIYVYTQVISLLETLRS